jgi:hypothetical protein
VTREEKAKEVRRLLKKYAAANPQLSINEIRIILALERATARFVSYPPLAGHLVFKGGFVLLKTAHATRCLISKLRPPILRKIRPITGSRFERRTRSSRYSRPSGIGARARRAACLVRPCWQWPTS